MAYSEGYEEEPDDDYSNDQLSNDSFGYGASEVTAPSFSGDNFVYARWRATPPYLKDIQSAILTAPITELYKSVLISVVHRLFTPTQQLGNNTREKEGLTKHDKIRKKMIFAERDLLLARCYATREDLIAVNAQLTENNILDVYEAVLSRTTGEKREGIINSEMTNRSISQIDRSTEFMEPSQKKGNKPNFFSFFGGK